MLQQTTVGAVLQRYGRFLTRFPDLPSLARASEDSVLAAWSGLGYYARARNLHRAARQIVGEHGGAIPRDPAILRRLPGFGDYMAAAVASLAFGARLPAADANVERVLSRVFALRGSVGSRNLREEVLARATSLLPARRAGDLTAALMDLGQMICLPRRPNCPVCPLARVCEARRRGDAERYPRRRPKPGPVRLGLAAAVCERNGRMLLVRRKSSWLDGLWEFPAADAASPEAARRALVRRVRKLGLELAGQPPIGRARHTVVNRRLEIAIYRAQATGGNGSLVPGARWFRFAELAAAAIPTLTRKIALAAKGSSESG